ncbi:hypothetical protein DFH09DRAFT_1336638 [Mycena vulgaris]|nr:hypothetical protein DFH09DRAFT_1336638 [Mycena vulgaris]
MLTTGRDFFSSNDASLTSLHRNTNRQAEIQELTSKGILPHQHELDKHPEKAVEGARWPIGSVAALIHEVLPAKEIIDSMVEEAAMVLTRGGSIVQQAKL